MGFILTEIFDSGIYTWNIFLLALLEIILVGWLYGIDTFFGNIKEMKIIISPCLRWYWKLSIQYFAPLILLSLFIAAIFENW